MCRKILNIPTSKKSAENFYSLKVEFFSKDYANLFIWNIPLTYYDEMNDLFSRKEIFDDRGLTISFNITRKIASIIEEY